MRLVPMTQRQTENLIAGAITGHERFIALKGNEESHQAGNELFEGMTTVGLNVRNTATLNSPLTAMAGLTLESDFNGYALAESAFTEDIDAMPDNVWSDYSRQVDTFKANVDAEVARQEARVTSFKEAWTNLRASYETGNEMEVAEALENIARAGNWGSKVPVGKIYGAVGEIKKLAGFDYGHGVPGAGDLSWDLGDVLYGAKVKSVIWGTLENPIWRGRKHAPAEDAIYRGALDHELMAKELLRTYGK